MSVEYVQSGAPRRSLLSKLALPLLAFIAGIALMGWLLTRWDAAATYLGVRPAPPPAATQKRPVPVRVLLPEGPPTPAAGGTSDTQRLVIDPETTRRVN